MDSEKSYSKHIFKIESQNLLEDDFFFLLESIRTLDMNIPELGIELKIF